MTTKKDLITRIFLLFPIVLKSTESIITESKCLRTPSSHGENGPIVNKETQCAMFCKARFDCYGYLYKLKADFDKGPNEYESNCIFQTVWDKEFLSQDILTPSSYDSKVINIQN